MTGVRRCTHTCTPSFKGMSVRVVLFALLGARGSLSAPLPVQGA